MTSNHLNPIIIGTSQYTQSKNALDPLDPIGMMLKTCQAALEDAGLSEKKSLLDALYVSNVYCLAYENAPDELAQKLGINPIQKFYAPIGGNTPQMLINRAAKLIESGEIQFILITGAESCYSLSRRKKKEITLNWEKGSSTSINRALLEYVSNMSPSEKTYKIFQPSTAYALFETALRAHSGRSIQDHLEHMGDLFEHFSRVASRNPLAWSREFLTKKEITTQSSDNRIINHPYLKNLVANPYVDQAAAIVMTSEKNAEKQGVDIKNWVYPMGGADLSNIQDLSRRPLLYDSPAIKEASKIALKQSGLSLQDINGFDLYSCFPCMVDIARDEIGISDGDPRPLTLTGGLSFFGAPFNNYSMHAIVTGIQMIRKNSSLNLMITANGGYNEKQSIGIYGKSPPLIPWNEINVEVIQSSILAEILPKPIQKANGFITIEAYMFYYDRNNEPTRGLVIGRLEGNERALAFIDAEKNALKQLIDTDIVGKIYPIKYDDRKKLNTIILS